MGTVSLDAALIAATLDEDGFGRVRTQPAIDGSATWKPSPNMCNLSGWTDAGDGTYYYDWIPTSGKKLYIWNTYLILNSVNASELTKSVGFKLVNCGDIGTTSAERVYTEEPEYIKACDDMFSFRGYDVMRWNYASPLIIKSSYSGYIRLILKNGVFTGTYACVKLKCLSLDDA